MVPSSQEQGLQSQPPHLGKSVTGLYKAFGRCQEVAQYGSNLHPKESVCPVPTAKRSHSKPPRKRRLDQPQHNNSFPKRMHKLSWAQATTWQNFRTTSRRKHLSQLLPPNQTVQVWPACLHPVIQCGLTGQSLTQEQAADTSPVWHPQMKRHFITQTLESTRIKV